MKIRLVNWITTAFGTTPTRHPEIVYQSYFFEIRPHLETRLGSFALLGVVEGAT